MKYRDLIELYNSNRASNILIYNTGGFGKTTQMKNLNKYLLAHLDQYKTIPMYIDAKALDKADEKPVLKYVTKIFCGIDITNTDEVEMFFEKRTGVYAYSYLFLIDAINEADDAVKAKIVTDIGRLKESDKIRFIVSSRVNEGYSVFNDFHKFEFCELTDEQIGTYLASKFSKSGIQVEKFNKSLVDILKIPMYLSVFSYAYKDETFPELYGEKTVRKADLLLAYLYKVAEESRMDKNLATSLEQEVQFTIEHYLPALAFKMCCQGKVSLNNEEYKEIKKELNTGYFLSFFDEEEREELYPMLSQTEKLKYEFPSIARKRLALWCKNGDDYAFSHQNWLQFFAARHIVNLMNAQKIDELEYPMDQEVRRFAGELICEYDKQFKYSKSNHADVARRCECDFESKTDTDSKMSPIEEFMQKNYVKLNVKSKSIANLIDTMKVARNNHITAKYDNLDLHHVVFGESVLKCSTFDFSKLYHYNFINEGHGGDVNIVTVTHDNKYIVSSGADASVRIWNFETKSQVSKIYLNLPFLTSLIILPNGKYIIGGDVCGLSIWDFHSCLLIKSYPIGWIESIATTLNNEYVICTGTLGTYRVTVETLDIEQISDYNLHHITTSQDDSYIIGFNVDYGELIVTKINMKTLCKENETYNLLKDENYLINTSAITISSDCKYIAIPIYNDNIIILFNFLTKKTEKIHLRGNTSTINSIIISNDDKYDDRYIICGDESGEIKMWNLESGAMIENFIIKHNDSVKTLAISNNNTFIISGSSDTIIKISELKSGRIIASYLLGNYQFDAIDISYDKNFLISATSNGYVYKLECCSGMLCWKHKVSDNCIYSVGISKNSTFFAFSGDDYNIYFCTTESNQSIEKPLIGHTAPVYRMAISEDSKYVISASLDQSILIWERKTGNIVKKIVLDKRNYVDISTCGKYIVIYNNDGLISLYEYKLFDIKLLYTKNFSTRIQSVKVFDTGCLAITDSYSKAYIVTNEKTYPIEGTEKILFLSEEKLYLESEQQKVMVFVTEPHYYSYYLFNHNNKSQISLFAFSNDGEIMTTCGWDGSIQIWNLSNKTRFLYQSILPLMINCHIENAIYVGNEKHNFYHILYANGAIIPKEYKPKPLPFYAKDGI